MRIFFGKTHENRAVSEDSRLIAQCRRIPACCFTIVGGVSTTKCVLFQSKMYKIITVMPRLHMQVWQLGTKRKACIKVLFVVKVTRYLVY